MKQKRFPRQMEPNPAMIPNSSAVMSSHGPDPRRVCSESQLATVPVPAATAYNSLINHSGKPNRTKTRYIGLLLLITHTETIDEYKPHRRATPALRRSRKRAPPQHNCQFNWCDSKPDLGFTRSDSSASNLAARRRWCTCDLFPKLNAVRGEDTYVRVLPLI